MLGRYRWDCGEPQIEVTNLKYLEAERYDRRAREWLATHVGELPDADGADSVPLALRAPYREFEARIYECNKPAAEVLDVCCGTGRYSLVAAHRGASVTAVDLAENNLVLARNRAHRAGVSLCTAVADAEDLPFPAASFDLVTCVGSLSYVDIARFVSEVRRVLRPGGVFVCLDSLNHNPFYRLNRQIQYWRGQRSRSTIVRMPTQQTICMLSAAFVDARITYHGVFSFLAPAACRCLGQARAAAWLDAVDARVPALRKWAFKFVFSAHVPST